MRFRLAVFMLLLAGALAAVAGQKGARGTNGQHTRPFFIVAHNPNELANVDDALAAGANALEPDVMKFSDETIVAGSQDHPNYHQGPSGLFMYHDSTTKTSRLPATVEEYFDHVHNAVLSGANVALITLDIKSPAIWYLPQLRDAVRSHLNHDGVRVNIIYSVGTLGDAALFGTLFSPTPFAPTLDDNEGLQIDGENDADAVLKALLADGGLQHVAFGNGSLGVSYGLAPNVVPSLDEASYLRASSYWDEEQYDNGGTGFGVAIPYAYPIPMGPPTAIGQLPLALLNSVDGLIPDADFQPQAFFVTVSNISELRAYIDADPNRYVATAADNPFYVPPEAYALAVGTDSGLLEGTSDTITFTLTGTCGSASISVDGDFKHRFHHDDVTYVTLPSKNLGRLTSLQISSNGDNDWKPTAIAVSSIRWGIPLFDPFKTPLGSVAVADFTGLVVNSSHSPVLPISGGHDCDQTPPTANPVVFPAANASGWWNSAAVTVTWKWSDGPGGSGVRPVACTNASTASAEGIYPLSVTCSDKEDNESRGVYEVRIDRTPPAVHCAAPDGQWHPADVSFACNASDGLSGLASQESASFRLGTGVPIGTETSNASTSSRVVYDNAGNFSMAGPITGIKIDKKAPMITITQPSAVTQYTHADTLHLDYGATDGGSGVASLTATLNGSATVSGTTLAGGQDIPLLTTVPLGQNSFEVQARDNVGNKRTAAVTFNVVASPQSLMADLSQLQGKGVNQRGDSLTSKLAEAANDFAAGNRADAKQVYNAFINEVVAQTGKSITPVAAAILIGDAQYVITLCQ